MWTPKATSLTCWLKAVSHVMSGVIFWMYFTLSKFLCSLAATFVQWRRRPPCRREIKKGRWKQNLRSVWWISTGLNRGQSSSLGPDVSDNPENPHLDSGSVKEAAGNCERNFVRNSPKTRTWKPANEQSKLKVREYICVANCGWRTIFIKKALQGVAGS